MSASIDQLQIDINASATKANTAIDKLVGKLDRVQTSLSGLNGNSLTNFANGCGVEVYPNDIKETHHLLCHISYFLYFEMLQN